MCCEDQTLTPGCVVPGRDFRLLGLFSPRAFTELRMSSVGHQLFSSQPFVEGNPGFRHPYKDASMMQAQQEGRWEFYCWSNRVLETSLQSRNPDQSASSHSAMKKRQ